MRKVFMKPAPGLNRIDQFMLQFNTIIDCLAYVIKL